MTLISARHLCAAAINSFDKMGPARIAWINQKFGGDWEEAFGMVAKGLLGDEHVPSGVTKQLVSHWKRQARTVNLSDLKRQLTVTGTAVLMNDDDCWPFGGDPAEPALVYCQGDIGLFAERSKVAMVGTRTSSIVGNKVAWQIGRGLAENGITVVSGLALGVDASSHRGAEDGGGRLIGVVGSGLNRPYPHQNADLWSRIRNRGLLVSEAPLNSPPARWRFPARNRLIASLADGVVVVESHIKGGALLTVDEALERDKPVLAVPGSVLSSASKGSNSLLADGAICVQDADDVIAALYGFCSSVEVGSWGGSGADTSRCGNKTASPAILEASGASGSGKSGRDVVSEEGSVSRQIIFHGRSGAVHVDELVAHLGIPIHEVLAEVAKLEANGLVTKDGSKVVSL